MECTNLDQQSCKENPVCEYNFDSKDSSGSCQKKANIVDMAREGNIEEVVSFLMDHTNMEKKSIQFLYKEAVLLFETLVDNSIDIRYALIMEDEDFSKWSGEFVKQIESEHSDKPSSSANMSVEYQKAMNIYNEQKRNYDIEYERVMRQRKQIMSERSSPEPQGIDIIRVPFNQEQTYNGNRYTVREGGIIEYWSEKQSNFANLTHLIKNTIFKTFFNAWSAKSAALASSIIGVSATTRDPMNGSYNDAIMVFIAMMFTLLMSFRIKYRSEIKRRRVGTTESNVSTGIPVITSNRFF